MSETLEHRFLSDHTKHSPRSSADEFRACRNALHLVSSLTRRDFIRVLRLTRLSTLNHLYHHNGHLRSSRSSIHHKPLDSPGAPTTVSPIGPKPLPHPACSLGWSCTVHSIPICFIRTSKDNVSASTAVWKLQLR